MHSLMAILAHPDDESLGFGGTLARYAAEGVHVSLVTATRGERGQHRGIRPGEGGHPGPDALAAIRERELRAAASVLGVTDVTVLGYGDQLIDRAEPRAVVADLVREVRRVQPDVVVTFGPDGAYGHPDHIAISQLATAALVAAADTGVVLEGDFGGLAPHAVPKLYFLAWPSAAWNAYERAFKRLVSRVDGVERVVVPWPDWAITTVVDTRDVSPAVWRAVQCHTSQLTVTQRAQEFTADEVQGLWGTQYFYRAFSVVNGGRTRETDLFEGLRR